MIWNSVLPSIKHMWMDVIHHSVAQHELLEWRQFISNFIFSVQKNFNLSMKFHNLYNVVASGFALASKAQAKWGKIFNMLKILIKVLIKYLAGHFIYSYQQRTAVSDQSFTIPSTLTIYAHGHSPHSIRVAYTLLIPNLESNSIELNWIKKVGNNNGKKILKDFFRMCPAIWSSYLDSGSLEFVLCEKMLRILGILDGIFDALIIFWGILLGFE